MKDNLTRLIAEGIFQNILRFFPSRIGAILRRIAYQPFFRKCGKKTAISHGCFLRGVRNISIGNYVSMGIDVEIYATGNGDESVEIGNNVSFNSRVMVNADCGGKIFIGNDVLIGPNTVIRASNHNFKESDKTIREQGHSSGVIEIAEDVWIGANVTILPGVKIAKGAVVAAGAVVSRNVESFTVVAGVPAEVVKKRGE